jgi:hypothetical protein
VACQTRAGTLWALKTDSMRAACNSYLFAIVHLQVRNPLVRRHRRRTYNAMAILSEQVFGCQISKWGTIRRA